MATALERYQNAAPGSEWTIDKIVALATELINEGRNLGELIYGLSMLSLSKGEEVSTVLSALWESHWEAKGKKSPPVKPLLE